MEENQEELTMDALDSTLDDLMKAAEATDLQEKLRKAGGVSVEHSGHYTEGGKKGGGLPGSGEQGGIDRMMIAKMTAALTGAGFSSDQVAAFMAGKAEEEEEEEEEDLDEEMEGAMRDAYAKGYAKARSEFGKSDAWDDDEEVESFRKSFEDDPTIAEAIDAAPFMESLTAKTTSSLDRIQKSVHDGFASQKQVNRALAAAFFEQGQRLKKSERVIDELARRLGMVERQPLPQKGRTAAPLHKSMPGEAGKGGPQQLRKSELLGSLSYLNLVKGEKHIAGEPTLQVISKLESTGDISKGAVEHVERFLATHPNEAEAAKAYS